MIRPLPISETTGIQTTLGEPHPPVPILCVRDSTFQILKPTDSSRVGYDFILSVSRVEGFLISVFGPCPTIYAQIRIIIHWQISCLLPGRSPNTANFSLKFKSYKTS